MNKEDNETLKQFQKNYDELMQDEKYQKYASLMEFYHKKIKNLQYQLRKKNKIIADAIDYIVENNDGYLIFNVNKLLIILERDKRK